MSHELEIGTDGQAKMFYAGELPWHKLGKSVANSLTSEEAIVAAGLDWTVDLGTLYGPNMEPVGTGHRAIFRESDGKVLGIAGNGYEPLQNAEMFEFTDSLVSDGVARYVTAGTLFGGKKVWMLMEMESGWQIAGEDFQSYVLMTSGHDCATAVRCLPTSVRVVCNNTLSMALGSKAGVRVTHNQRMGEKLEAAKSVLQITTESQRRMKVWLEAATKANMVTRRVDYVTRARDAVFGELHDDTPVIKRYVIESFQSIYDAERERNGDTAYSFINAVTGYVDHKRWYKGENEDAKAESRFMGITSQESAGMALKNKAIKVLADLHPSLGKPEDIKLPERELVFA